MAFQAIACGGFDSTVGRKAAQLLDMSLIVAEQGSLTLAEHSRKLRRCRPKAGDACYFDEVCLRINGVLRDLWHAVDQHGAVLGILVQEWRNATAANRFFEHLLADLKCKPRKIITDGLRSYDAAKREVLPDVRQRTSRYLGNHPENSPHPPRHRERQMQRFKSPEQAQRFL